MGVLAGCDSEVRTRPKVAYGLGLSLGKRAYNEAYSMLGVGTELNHDVVEASVRSYVVSRLHAGLLHDWSLNYGLVYTARSKSRISVSDALGRSGSFRGDETAAWGLRLGVLHANRAWLNGTMQIGLMAELSLVGNKQELYLPWLGRNSLEIGRSRCSVGVVLRYRLWRLAWRPRAGAE